MKQQDSFRRYMAAFPAGILVILILALAVAGCVSSQAREGGNNGVNNGSEVVQIVSVLENPKSFEGKEVFLTGRITGECGSGCWFLLDDGTGTIYVDTKPGNFAIPQLPGKQVRVRGTVASENGDVALFATTVESGGTVYP